MIKQGRLSRGCRDNRHLQRSGEPYSGRRRPQTHSLAVEQENLHLARGRLAVTDSEHLGDVAGDGLGDVHGLD